MSVRIFYSLSPSPHNMKFAVCIRIHRSIPLCDNMNMCIFFHVERSLTYPGFLNVFFSQLDKAHVCLFVGYGCILYNF